ncbi:MAG: acetyl-CoA C-acyltransferase [Deltaproteobacteria bacterium]|nr:MAG: acetyl-CoA C-acyltransferase [Deltaproteobacteria bacterium]
MRDAYIVSSVRTPGCKNRRGAFRETRPEELLAFIMKAAVEKINLDPKEIDDCMVGCAFPEGEQGLNIGRLANQMAGFPEEVSGATVNRFCSSGLEAICLASLRVQAGWSEITLGGGLESMTYVPMGGHSPRPHPEFAKTNPESYISMGVTAENVVDRYGITRQEMDEFAADSNAKAAEAQKNGYFTEIVPTPANYYVQKDGNWVKETKIIEADDGVREGTTAEGIARLNSPFKAGGNVTAANSSQTTDGAAATVIASKEACDRLGLTPIAKIVSYAVAGCKSDEMGVGPKYAIPKVLKNAGMTLDQIDVIELNEAFASQSIHCLKELGIWGTDAMKKVNINGGAIALGHPLGCTGAKLTATLLSNLKRTGGKYGIVSMCIGGGMGAACIFEMV